MADDDINDDELSELLDSALSDIDAAKQNNIKSSPQNNSQTNQTTNNGAIPNSTKKEPPPSNVDFEAEAAKLAQLFSSAGMNEGDVADEESLEKLLSMMQSSLDHILSSEEQNSGGKTTRPSNQTSPPPATKARSDSSSKESDNPLLKALEDLSSNLPEFNESDFGAAASGGPDAFLSAMLAPLLAKDVVYEPLKSLTEKYPAWLDSQNPGPEKESRMRQADLMKKVCLEYEHARGENGNLDPSQIQKVAAILESAMKEGPPPPQLVDSDEESSTNLPECKGM